MDAEKFKNQLTIDFDKVRTKIKNLKTASKAEAHDTYVAAEILLLFLEDKPVSEAQIKFLKEQSIDFTKVIILIGLQAVPGSSIGIIALEEIGKKHGFSIFPHPQNSSKLM